MAVSNSTVRKHLSMYKAIDDRHEFINYLVCNYLYVRGYGHQIATAIEDHLIAERKKLEKEKELCKNEVITFIDFLLKKDVKKGYDYSTGKIKHEIEKEFAFFKAKYLSPEAEHDIVTGPDFLRHVEDIHSINHNKLTIYETNLDTYNVIREGLRNYPNIEVLNECISYAHSLNIDADLTALSHLPICELALMNQIWYHRCNAQVFKCFTFTVDRRNPKGGITPLSEIMQKIIGILGDSVISEAVPVKLRVTKPTKAVHKHEITFAIKTIRIEAFKAYAYNASGGPMFTCCIIYK